MDLAVFEKKIIEKSQKFETYFRELSSYNDKVNLTAITGRHEVFTKHFLDSILPIDEIPHGAKMVDVGAGGGFPGLPIKIVRDDIDLTMVDALFKRVVFLNLICDKLKVNATNVHARAEEYAKTARESFDIGVARAVARLTTLLEYLLPLVKVGGKVLCYKGSNYDEELEEAQNAIGMLGGQVEKILKFTLPNNFGDRNIIVIKKINHTPPKYPRGKNLPKTNPIK